MKRPLAYITAPWSENEFENTENAAKYCRAVYDAGFSPLTLNGAKSMPYFRAIRLNEPIF